MHNKLTDRKPAGLGDELLEALETFRVKERLRDQPTITLGEVHGHEAKLHQVPTFGDLILLDPGTVLLYCSTHSLDLVQTTNQFLDFEDGRRTPTHYVFELWARTVLFHEFDRSMLIRAFDFSMPDKRVFRVEWDLAKELRFGHRRDPEMAKRWFAHQCGQFGIDPEQPDAAAQYDATIRLFNFAHMCHLIGVKDPAAPHAREQIKRRALLAESGEIGYNAREQICVSLRWHFCR